MNKCKIASDKKNLKLCKEMRKIGAQKLKFLLKDKNWLFI